MRPCRNNSDPSYQAILNSWQIHKALDVLQDGGVIVYPTEAVLGLGCDPWNGEAVQQLLRLKQRPVDKGLIIVAAAVEQLAALVNFLQVPAPDQIIASWPGPVTWLLPAYPDTPGWLTGQHDTLAVRVSAHPLVRQLCERVGPLVSTSANPSRCRPARSTRRARAYFGRRVDYYLPGNVGGDPRPSVIRDAVTGRVLRS